MARYVTKIRSPRPAPEVFEALCDFTSTAAWDPGVVEARRLDGDDRPPETGSAFEVVVQAGPGRIPMRYEITALDRSRRSVTLDATTPFLRSHDVITVDADGGDSIVTYDATLRLRGLARLAEPLLAVVFGGVGDRAATGLARWLDAAGHERVAA